MKHVSSSHQGLRPGHIFLSAFLAIGLILVLLSLSSSASGPQQEQLLALASSVGEAAEVAVSEPATALVSAAIEATTASTQTFFLPFVAKNHSPYPPTVFGVQLYQPIEDEDVSLLPGTRARWLRIPLFWSEIEPENTTPENFQWSGDLDARLAQLAGNNVDFLFTLTGNPAWAATYPMGPIDRADISELVEFMVAAVEHYSAPPYEVRYWEIYNEIDNGGCVSCAETGNAGLFGHYPQEYVNLLAAIYQPMKTADPEAQIVFGGIAYDAFDDLGGPFIRAFLDNVLAAGGGNYFDVMNFHFYPAFAAYWEEYGIDVLGKVNFLQDKLAYYGLDKRFICSECGMWSDDAHGPPYGSHEAQSRYVPQIYARSMAADLDIAIWFQFEDFPGWDVGLVDMDLVPKPSYYAYQTAAQQLFKTEYVRTLDPTETGSDQVEAYEFLEEGSTTKVLVVWTNDDGTHFMSVVADELVMIDKWGTQTTVHDGDDGAVDGQVRLTIGPSPVYLRIQP